MRTRIKRTLTLPPDVDLKLRVAAAEVRMPCSYLVEKILEAYFSASHAEITQITHPTSIE